MEHTSLIWTAVSGALNLTGVSALITGIFLITKGRSDAKALKNALEQKTRADERDDTREDANSLTSRAVQAAGILDNAAKTAANAADYWQKQWRAAQDELDYRNKRLNDCRTNASEIFDLLSVPGALAALKDHRDEYEAHHAAPC